MHVTADGEPDIGMLDIVSNFDVTALRPGVDGLVLERGSHRSTFLPQVWESLSEPPDFVAALKQKAGLERDFWSDGMRFSRYAVEKYKESD